MNNSKMPGIRRLEILIKETISSRAYGKFITGILEEVSCLIDR